MRIGYFGTPEHSKQLLEKLIRSGIEVAFVVTNPDKPFGRKRELKASPVKEFAGSEGIPVYQPVRWKESTELMSEICSKQVDVNIVYAYGSLIPERIFRNPVRGSINLHGSLLPKYRGASPVQSAILDGLNQTGFSIQYLEKELDSGDILYTESLPIDLEDTTETILQKMTDRGATAILNLLRESKWTGIPQDHTQSTHCKKLNSDDRRLDFSRTARQVHDRVRALIPNMPAFFEFRGKRILLHRSTLEESSEIFSDRQVGEVIVDGKKSLFVICGDKKMIGIKELQPEGKKIMSAADFLNGIQFQKGETFH